MTGIFLASLILGLFAGLFAGLFGIGGGLIIVPVLVMLFKIHSFPSEQILLIAIATSLASIILTGISSVFAHHRLGAVLWANVWRLTPMIMLGSILGAIIAKQMPSQLLRYILIIFLIYVGTLMALQIKPKAKSIKYSKLFDYSVALLIGLLSAIVGIGGGTLTVPYLVHRHISIHHAIAIASACGVPIAIAGTMSYIVLGWNQPHLMQGQFGYICLPAFLGITFSSVLTAPLGAKLAHKLPAKQLKRYFSILLFMMAAKLAWH